MKSHGTRLDKLWRLLIPVKKQSSFHTAHVAWDSSEAEIEEVVTAYRVEHPEMKSHHNLVLIHQYAQGGMADEQQSTT